jgi:hypothetical protein
MTLPELPYNFHDAGVDSIVLGPRNEVTLLVGLDEPGDPSHSNVYVRFGGITNYQEVASFTERVPGPKAPQAYRARIEILDYDTQENSRHGSLVFKLVLDAAGQVLIRCRNVASGLAHELCNLHSQSESDG